jgi:hypothetical protein
MSKARDLANAGTALTSVSATELGYVDGVTSAIQTQIDTKAPSSTAVTLTGTQTLTNKTLTNPVIASVVNNTLTSTTGDMIYASAANTPARLGIGSTDQILKVTGGVPTWATASASAAPWTKTTSGSLSGSSVSVTGLTKNDIMVTVNNFSATSTGSFAVRWNNDSGTNYGPGLDNATNRQECFSSILAAASGQAVASIQNAQSNQTVKMTFSNLYTGFWLNTAAVTSVTLIPTAGTFDNGSYEVWER